MVSARTAPNQALKGKKEYTMKTSVAVVGGLVAAVVIAGAIYLIDIDQTQEGSLPDVDVSVEGGELPKFDAEVGSIEMTEEEVTVEVPKVEVTSEEETVTVPGISVTPPDEEPAQTE
jgi:hypothetical protein